MGNVFRSWKVLDVDVCVRPPSPPSAVDDVGRCPLRGLRGAVSLLVVVNDIVSGFPPLPQADERECDPVLLVNDCICREKNIQTILFI